MKNSKLEGQSVNLEGEVSKVLALRQNVQSIFDSLGIQDIEENSEILGDGNARDDTSYDVNSLIDSFTKKGWEVKLNRTLRGRSGADHTFSIISVMPQNNIESIERREFVGIDVVTSQRQVESGAVLMLFAKSLDCDIRWRMIIAIPKLSDQARILAKSYNMQFVEAENLNLASILLQGILELLTQRKKELISRSRTRNSNLSKRNSIDIMTDILTITAYPSSKSEIMSRGNLSYEQCQNYIPILEKLGLVVKNIEDGVHIKFTITDKGREYLTQLSDQFGRIAEGDKPNWIAGRGLTLQGSSRTR